MEMALQPMPIAEIIPLLQGVYNDPDPMPYVKKEANQEPQPTFGPIPIPEWLILILKRRLTIYPLGSIWETFI